MAKTSVILDASALVAFLDPREHDHKWAVSLSKELPAPWLICEPALTESFFLLDDYYRGVLIDYAQGNRLRLAFNLADELEAVFNLMNKYADVPMSLADACLVRMSEIVAEPLVLTTDSDFRLYRRHGRQVIPCRMP